MRFLFIDFSLPYLLKDEDYPIGGWAVELNVWIKGIRAIGHEAGVLTFKGAKNFIGNNCDVDLIETYNPDKGIKVIKYFYDYIPTIIKATKEYDPDIIIQACCGLKTGIMAFTANILNVPFVYRVANDIDADKRYENRLLRYEQYAYRYGIRKAKIILCQNEYQYNCFKKKYPDKKIYTIHNPFDVGMEKENEGDSEKRYIAWLGVFSKQKNMGLLLDIVKALPDIQFKIAGIESKEIDIETLEILDKLKLMKNTEFVGYVKRKKVLEFLSRAVALLSTSSYEGFSNTFLESLFSGTPVVLPQNVDPDHIIKNNKLGFTSKSEKELCKLVNKIYEMKKEEYNILSKRCRDYIIENHSAESKAQEMIRVVGTTEKQ